MRKIAIINRKGGTSKSTTALNLGSGIHRTGNTVLFVDTDSQCDLTTNLGQAEKEPSIYEVMTGGTTALKAITKTAEGDLIAGSPMMATIDTIVKDKRKEYVLFDALKPLSRKYSYCIIDTPPALGTAMINALVASDSIIIPVEPKQSSFDALVALNDSINTVRQHTGRKIPIAGILICRYRKTILANDMIENFKDVAKHLHTKVFDAVIRESVAISEAEVFRKSIFEYAPRSAGAEDYSRLTGEVMT